MGVFDALINEVTASTGMGDGSNTKLLGGVMEMLNSSPQGGLQELVSGFEKAGLGHIAQSWVSTGPNLAATPQQVQAGFGEQKISGLAQQLGLSPQMVSMALSVLLPVLIDKLTPKGQLPKAQGPGGLASVVTGMLGGMLGGSR